MAAVLETFLPVYREIIYNPIQEQFKIQISDLRKTISSVDIGKLFTKVEHFYNSSWNNSIPFILNFCPEPKSPDLGFSATAFYNLAVSNIPVNDTNYNLILSVLFHESFHILYDEESLSFKNKISNWFTNNPSKVSTYANLLFNEAVTTALSSGYLYRELSGSSLKNEDWYHNKYIASMAVAMFPMVKEYLKENKYLDKKFIDNYIKLYEEKFPGWITDLNNIMSDRFIIAENHKDYSSIIRKFSRGNIEEYRNELNLLTLQEMKKSPITKVVVITKNNKQDIHLLKDVFKELNNWNPDLKKDFTYSKVLNDKTYLIVVNSINKPVEELINEIIL
ncbi:MAG TPA: hypothetical protein VMU83_17315 [Hanamia sp.]|nr:hypothetical protein [Hanamia sp.]